MIIYFTYGFLFAYVTLPGVLLGDLVFRCPSCTAERLATCPKVTALCAEIVREPGCGCCPVCARTEGELCGVYTPRCSSGLRCYPSVDAELPLRQLIQGLGRCGQKVDVDVTSGKTLLTLRCERTVKALLKGNTQRQHSQQLETGSFYGTETESTTHACQQELDKVLKEISRMTSEENRGPMENLYGLKFPNCDRYGLYNLKQCNMSTHGQRGECWCVNPLTGVHIPETPIVRGDPNCDQFQELLRAMPTAAPSR
uniref:Insulin-like growth factor-binding protein 2-B n=1 Tax=Salarias fasciatus TaxID=181472 RepID=A0A672I9L6_SALFA